MRHGLIGSVLLWLIAACGAAEPQAPPSAPPQAAVSVAQHPVPTMPARTTQLWASSCALCHVDGNAMAPRIGHADEWGPRLAKGRDVLLQHTLQGFNDMPPLGYCMACETADFELMIEFMTAAFGPQSGGGR